VFHLLDDPPEITLLLVRAEAEGTETAERISKTIDTLAGAQFQPWTNFSAFSQTAYYQPRLWQAFAFSAADDAALFRLTLG
jgi:hypothetical protein